MSGDRFVILAVCHANLCRSPIAEGLLRRALDLRLPDEDGFAVCSAGVSAWNGQPIHPFAAEVLAEYGVVPDGFRSRRVTPELVKEADLILTATRKQRSACVTLLPTAVRHTFTFLQFGRLVEVVPRLSLLGLYPVQARLRTLIDELAVVRAEVQPATGDDDDLVDPVNQPVERFRRCARELSWMTDVLLDRIAPA